MDIQRVLLWAGLAVVSYLLVLAWNEDYNQPTQRLAPTEQITTIDQTASEFEAPDLSGQRPVAGDDTAEFATPEDRSQSSMSAADASTDVSDKLVRVRTDVFDITIDRVGGNLINAYLLQYNQSLNSREPLALLQNNEFHTYVLESGLIGRDGFDSTRNGPAPVYETSADAFVLSDNENELVVDLVFTSETGITVTKRYTFERDSYEIDVRYIIDNRSDATWQGNFAGKIVRDTTGDPTSQNTMGFGAYLGMVLSTPDDPYEKFDFRDLGRSPINQTVQGGWLAFLQHYFISAWVPNPNQTHQYQTTQRGGLHVMGFVSPATVVQPGETMETGATAYVGPKIIDRLKPLAPNLHRTVDFGFLFFIALPLFIILDWFHGIVGNWGVAIILLTVLVKAVFFHLSATSYRSMAKMRAVAPQLQRLRELHGDDRQRMSQEMMALYKREKINPLGGCLPILVQMPVFIALYWVLFESVQLRHAPFFLWIHDLSVMDPYFILPILMGISMFIQMSLNPTPPDPVQAKVMKMMPFIFTIFFLWFPAGLVLYWLVNNILSIGQQWYITRKIEAEMAAKKR
ncbi:MAG: membrane protein insertase YidC [Marinobacter sp.]|nr:membrane protein insertase YidC [Marinobacter sp.]